MKCYLCSNIETTSVKGTVRDKPEIKILKCNKCGLIFLDTVNHIDENFYENNGMQESLCNTEVPISANDIDTEQRYKHFVSLLKEKSVLDFGCGKASFLKKLKEENICKSLHALEPNNLLKKELQANFIYHQSINEIQDNSIDAITMFHVLEHLKNPIEVLNALYEKLSENGLLIIEVPNADDVLLNLYENENFANFTYWSCHLFLYNQSNLATLLSKTKFKNFEVKQHQRYNLANHLYWLAKGKPGGHNIWTIFNDADLQEKYAQKLAEIQQCDTLLAIVKKD